MPIPMPMPMPPEIAVSYSELTVRNSNSNCSSCSYVGRFLPSSAAATRLIQRQFRSRRNDSARTIAAAHHLASFKWVVPDEKRKSIPSNLDSGRVWVTVTT
jgi:hypothetical protein